MMGHTAGVVLSTIAVALVLIKVVRNVWHDVGLVHRRVSDRLRAWHERRRSVTVVATLPNGERTRLVAEPITTPADQSPAPGEPTDGAAS
jgi:hypothetical protein